jgi:hypothetical protein
VPGVLNRIAVRPPPWATVECAPSRNATPAPGSIEYRNGMTIAIAKWPLSPGMTPMTSPKVAPISR